MHRLRTHQRPPAAGDQDNAGLTRCAGISIGHVGGSLLMAGQDQLDLRVEDGIKDRHHRAAGQTEDVFHAFLTEGFDDDVGACCHFNLSPRRAFSNEMSLLSPQSPLGGFCLER